MRPLFFLLILPLSGLLTACRQPTPTSVAQSTPTTPTNPVSQTALWMGSFADQDWLSRWGVQPQGSWGLPNIRIQPDPTGRFRQVLRVRYPAGSASPSVAREHNAPLGGAQFYANLGMAPQTALRLRYYVRFAPTFDFVKGGKLPGLYGGTGNSGGDIPDGEDGFSTRFMWRRNGDGEVYAYLPTSKEYGTAIGRGKWRFQPGVWHQMEQAVVLNQPGKRNGSIQVWFDGKLVLEKSGLTFRTIDRLKIDGLFFSTFFGGNDPSWATPKDVYIDFAEFAVIPVNHPNSQ